MKSICITLLCSICLIVIFGSIKSSFVQPHAKVDALDYDRFWLKKTFSSSEYDVVVVGDSRVKNAFSPTHMEKELPGMKVLNFGYNGMILDKSMLEAAGKKLAPERKDHIIIIGISPGEFIETKDRNGLYLEFKNKGRSEYLLIDYFEPTMRWLSDITKSISIDDFKKRKGLEGKLAKEYLESGWMSVAAENVHYNEVTDFVKDEIANKKDEVIFLSEKIVNDAVEKVGQWTREGIRVFVLRIPQHPLFKDFEDKLYRFDEANLRSRIEKSGGVWLDLANFNYSTFDGVHLEKSSAERFSAEVARNVRNATIQVAKKIDATGENNGSL